MELNEFALIFTNDNHCGRKARFGFVAMPSKAGFRHASKRTGTFKSQQTSRAEYSRSKKEEDDKEEDTSL